LTTTYIIFNVIRRVKERATWHPPCPTSIRDLIILDQYMCLSDGSQFLLHDSGVHDDERFIIVGSMTGLHALSMSSDGMHMVLLKQHHLFLNNCTAYMQK